jgi:hypothetical protein
MCGARARVFARTYVKDICKSVPESRIVMPDFLATRNHSPQKVLLSVSWARVTTSEFM